MSCRLKNLAVFAVLIILFAGFSWPAAAQRTVRGQFFGSANYMKTVTPSQSLKVWGVEAYVGQYMGSFYWYGGLQMTPPWKESRVGCFNISGGAMYRLFCSRNRMFNGYVGGGALFGVDFPDWNKAAYGIIKGDDSDAGSTSEETFEEEFKTGIMFGFEPRLELEFFPLRTVAIVGGATLPIRISMKNQARTQLVTARLYAGIRFVF